MSIFAICVIIPRGMWEDREGQDRDPIEIGVEDGANDYTK